MVFVKEEFVRKKFHKKDAFGDLTIRLTERKVV